MRLAGSIGLAERQFVECLSSAESTGLVEQHVRAGHAAGVTGTPTFVVNGQIHRGALSYPQWTAILSEHLQQAMPGSRKGK